MDPKDFLQRAFLLHKAGRPAEAAPGYRRTLVLEPDNADALHLLGLIARQDGDAEAGARLIGRALAVQPRLDAAYINLGNVFYGLGRLEETEAVVRRLLARMPESGVGLAMLGHVRLHQGRLDEAERLLCRAVVTAAVPERIPLAVERCRSLRRLAAPAPGVPAGIVVRGPFRDSSGYAYAIRQFVRHLAAAGVAVQLADLMYLPEDGRKAAPLDPLFQSLARPVRAKAVLHFTTPPMVEKVPGLRTINYTMAESSTVPPSWVRHNCRHDALIVPTMASRAAWIASGCPAGLIRVCPAGVDPVEEGVPESEIVDGFGRRLSGYRTRILNISDTAHRKNLGGLFRVWLRAARAGDDAALVLKAGKDDAAARYVQALFRQAVHETGIAPQDAAPFFLVTGRFSDRDMLSLFAACTHYCSLSHGEGWDLPMTQAGAMGLTLIAPRHSAYTAYLDDDTAHLLPCAVTAAGADYAGLSWWTPDEDAAVERLARIIRDPDAHRRSARERLRSDFTWERAARTLIATLEELGAL